MCVEDHGVGGEGNRVEKSFKKPEKSGSNLAPCSCSFKIYIFSIKIEVLSHISDLHLM